MIEVAAFASSQAGQAFARIEQHFGRDPARFIEDEVLAHNLRAALIFTLNEEPEPQELKLADRG